MRRLLLTGLGLVTGVAAVFATTGVLAASASVSGPPAAGSTGFDISWPQCSASYPAGGSFGIVGVTNGRPWGANPCLAGQFGWAKGYTSTPELYMNTANPAPHSSFYWPATGSSDPKLCRDASSTSDPGCAYDYGWHAAANAMGTAATTSSTAAQDIWWLDVETGNTWNGDGYSNAADIQGSIDYLRSQGVPTVGVYSTGYQWTAITGGYAAGNASNYAAAWQPEFTSPNGIAASPSWVAGAGSQAEARSNCASSFLGTSTSLTQYPSGSFDGDYACGAGSPPPPPPPPTAGYTISASPSSVSASARTTVTLTITLKPSGGWNGSVTLRISESSRVTGSLSRGTVTLPGTATLSLRSSTPGTYTITVTATPAAGSTTSTPSSTRITFTVPGGRDQGGGNS